jgi:hypothetical protein
MMPVLAPFTSSMTPQDIKQNTAIGQKIFESIPNNSIPAWSGAILSCFDNYLKQIPEPVLDLFTIINDKSKWSEAHEQFTNIRRFLLANKSFQPESYLLLSELVAKVTYNASGQPAPFDSDSGFYIPSLAISTVDFFADKTLLNKVMSAILKFSN